MASIGGSSSGCDRGGNNACSSNSSNCSPVYEQVAAFACISPTSCAGGVLGIDGSVPQWKRELIQRRRQQQQQQIAAGTAAANSLARPSAAAPASGVKSGGTSTTVAGGVGGAARGGAVAEFTKAPSPLGGTACIIASSTAGGDAADAAGALLGGTASIVNNGSGSSEASGISSASGSDMRLDVTTNAAPQLSAGNATDDLLRKSRPAGKFGRSASKEVLDIVELVKMRNNAKADVVVVAASGRQEDYESDSSEELQYGPGIVHKLRSKYLNMTLREMNKNRGSVQCFRRAASLEDLLDHKDDSAEKTRRYAKKNVTSAAAKLDRYRNAARGNDSMKRARSVETLMRYNSAVEESNQNHIGRLVPNIFKQENDHIILVDRTVVKIENRLMDKDRLKPINKPKRMKPVLADTERPPPDLVKTTMRIFENSAIKKLKPKGEVAAKVATFKTINDTFKAQNQKKIIPKPPLQPKPFINGNSKVSASPRKIIITQKPTAEIIEKKNNQETYRNEGVITDPIVQSVSSVVSKFQQIEKAHSPSPSPEPSFNKIKFSPVSSPEPVFARARVSSLDIKSPTTPIPSPRTSYPKAQSPLSPRSDIIKPPAIILQKAVMNSTPISSKFEHSKFSTSSDVSKIDFEQDKDEPSEEQVKQATLELNNQNAEASLEVSKLSDSPSSSLSSTMLIDSLDDTVEIVDSPRSVSQSAMDNISKAGMTVQFSFSDNSSIKTYLPRSVSSPEQIDDMFYESESSIMEAKSKSYPSDSQSASATFDVSMVNESPHKLQERLQMENVEEIHSKQENLNIIENKPIGAISSLSLIKSTTTTSFSQGNESKTIRSQKSDATAPPQKQIGIIRPLVSTKTQLPQQNLSNRELEKNLINRAKSIEQPKKVVVSLKSAEEIQPVKKNNSSGGLWDSKVVPWNQQNNTMVFNFSNRKDIPDYIENDGLIIKRKRDKTRPGDIGDHGCDLIVSSVESVQLTDDSDTEISVGPPSPCDVAFCNDNVLINGRSNLSRTPRNHKHRIQFDDTATRTFEYPSEASILEPEAIASRAAPGTGRGGIVIGAATDGGASASGGDGSNGDGVQHGRIRRNERLRQQQQQQQQQQQLRPLLRLCAGVIAVRRRIERYFALSARWRWFGQLHPVQGRSGLGGLRARRDASHRVDIGLAAVGDATATGRRHQGRGLSEALAGPSRHLGAGDGGGHTVLNIQGITFAGNDLYYVYGDARIFFFLPVSYTHIYTHGDIRRSMRWGYRLDYLY